MATSKKFSELTAASAIGNNDLFAIAQENAQAETGYVSRKALASLAGQKIVHGIEYETLLANFPSGKRNPTDALNELNNAIESLYPVNTASGAIANFTTSLAKPLTALTSTIVAQQAGSGTPSPQNERSISGVSSVGFTQTGKNLWNGTASPTGTYRSSAIDFFLPAGDYVFSATVTSSDTDGTKSLILLRDIDNGAEYVRLDRNTRSSFAITFTKDIVSIQFFAGFNDVQSAGDTYTFADLQIEKGSTATAYEVYNLNDTFTIAIGQTIYGGVIDAINGNANKTDDIGNLSDLEWSYNADAGVFYTTTKLTGCATNPTTCKCSCYDFNSSANGSNLSIMSAALSDKQICAYSNSTNAGRIVVKDSNYTDATTFVNSLSNQEILYPLATPVEITGLTPDNFTTIIGENNIFSDCGEVSVGFKQTVQEYIDAKIAETQALIL